MTRPTERHGGIPAVQHLSDDELLRLLLGEDADALLSRHSLPLPGINYLGRSASIILTGGSEACWV